MLIIREQPAKQQMATLSSSFIGAYLHGFKRHLIALSILLLFSDNSFALKCKESADLLLEKLALERMDSSGNPHPAFSFPGFDIEFANQNLVSVAVILDRPVPVFATPSIERGLAHPIAVAQPGNLYKMIRYTGWRSFDNPLDRRPNNDGSWAHVRDTNGKEGWIFAEPHCPACFGHREEPPKCTNHPYLAQYKTYAWKVVDVRERSERAKRQQEDWDQLSGINPVGRARLVLRAIIKSLARPTKRRE